VIGVVRFVYLLALAVWIGEIVFFSFVAAPAIFGVLGAARAGAVVGAIFPRYYALGTAAAAIAVACAAVLALRATAWGWWPATLACLVVGLAAMLWAAAVVHPRAQRLRLALEASGGVSGEDPAFRAAHRSAVALNAAALVAGVAGLGLTAGALRQ
jgi:uncharacterized membrane protein